VSKQRTGGKFYVRKLGKGKTREKRLRTHGLDFLFLKNSPKAAFNGKGVIMPDLTQSANMF